MRTFVALLLPGEVRQALAAEIDRLRPLARDVAWVAADNLHLTLKFLGEVEPVRVELVAATLETIATGAAVFELGVRGLGAFPSPARPRVIWAGVDAGALAAAALAGRIDEALARLDFEREARAFAGHVTLGRVRLPRRDPKLAAALGAAADRRFGAFRVEQVTLMQSELGPRGARYTEIGSWPLAGW